MLKRDEKGCMGKSIRVCEKWSERLAFPHWSSKGYFTPKKLVSIAHARHGVWESGGISAGGVYTVFIFCIRIRVGVGDDQCLFNVAAGIKPWIIGSGAILFYLALSLMGLRAQPFLSLVNMWNLDHVNNGAKYIWHKCGKEKSITKIAWKQLILVWEYSFLFFFSVNSKFTFLCLIDY